MGGIVKLSVSAYELTDITHLVVAEDIRKEVIAPGTAAAGYLGRQILGSASTHGEFTGGKSVNGLYLLIGFRTTVIPHFE